MKGCVCTRKIQGEKRIETLFTALSTAFFERLFCPEITAGAYYKRLHGNSKNVKTVLRILGINPGDWEWVDDLQQATLTKKDLNDCKMDMTECFVKALIKSDAIVKTIKERKENPSRNEWNAIAKGMNCSLMIYGDESDEKIIVPESELKEPLALYVSKQNIMILYTKEQALQLCEGTPYLLLTIFRSYP
jgi:hypothetical protein